MNVHFLASDVHLGWLAAFGPALLAPTLILARIAWRGRS